MRTSRRKKKNRTDNAFERTIHVKYALVRTSAKKKNKPNKQQRKKELTQKKIIQNEEAKEKYATQKKVWTGDASTEM